MSQEAPNQPTTMNRGALLAAIASDEEDFRAAILRAHGNGPGLDARAQTIADGVIREFTALRQRVLNEPDADDDDLNAQSQALARMRAYVLPPSELISETEEVLNDLRHWGVPTPQIQHVETLLRDKIRKATESGEAGQEAARATFNRVLEEYDTWSTYIDWFWAEPIRKAMWILGLVAAAGLGTAAATLTWWHNPLTLFVGGGALGAAVSILLKLPGPTQYKDIAAFASRATGRFLAGVTGAMVGYGLLTSGLIKLSIGNGASLGELVSLLADGEATPSQGALLAALAILLGFSERALASFDATVFGKPQNARSQKRDTGQG